MSQNHTLCKLCNNWPNNSKRDATVYSKIYAWVLPNIIIISFNFIIFFKWVRENWVHSSNLAKVSGGVRKGFLMPLCYLKNLCSVVSTVEDYSDNPKNKEKKTRFNSMSEEKQLKWWKFLALAYNILFYQKM